jgi:hypothetical protein
VTSSRRLQQEFPHFYVWESMLARCYNPKTHNYHRYGGRGIHVCERWRTSMAAFFQDMGPRPSDDHTIERIDNDSNYEPSNCRWATKVEQANNRRSCRYVTIDGETLTVSQWCVRNGIRRATVKKRVRGGWSYERALSTPARPIKWGRGDLPETRRELLQ